MKAKYASRSKYSLNKVSIVRLLLLISAGVMYISCSKPAKHQFKELPRSELEKQANIRNFLISDTKPRSVRAVAEKIARKNCVSGKSCTLILYSSIQAFELTRTRLVLATNYYQARSPTSKNTAHEVALLKRKLHDWDRRFFITMSNGTIASFHTNGSQINFKMYPTRESPEYKRLSNSK